MNTPTAEPPDLINLMEWNRFAEDRKTLLEALKIIAANPGASHGPSCIYDSGPIARGAVGVFLAKHPATT